MNDDVRFRSFPAAAFPFTVTYLDHDTGELVHRDRVDGPGALPVPALGPRKVDVIVMRADGKHSVYVAPDD